MRRSVILFAVLSVAFLAACSGSDEPAAPNAVATAVAVPAMDHIQTDEVMTVYASPTCGCCHEYIPYLEGHGLTVKTEVTEDVNSIKEEYGIPESAWSCHTAVIGDYYVEGHVPIEAVERLLEDEPNIDGIALPGMPAGSPGMDGEKVGPFEVVAIKDGQTKPYMSI